MGFAQMSNVTHNTPIRGCQQKCPLYPKVVSFHRTACTTLHVPFCAFSQKTLWLLIMGKILQMPLSGFIGVLEETSQETG